MDNRCVICKHLGVEAIKRQLFENTLYSDGETIKVHLCRVHDIELFKMGQVKFLIAYSHITHDILESDHPDFIELIHQTVQKHAV